MLCASIGSCLHFGWGGEGVGGGGAGRENIALSSGWRGLRSDSSVCRDMAALQDAAAVLWAFQKYSRSHEQIIESFREGSGVGKTKKKKNNLMPLIYALKCTLGFFFFFLFLFVMVWVELGVIGRLTLK